MPQFHNSSKLGNDSSQGGVQLLQMDQRLPGHEADIGEGGLRHGLRTEVPVMDDPGGGGGEASPVTSGAVVTSGVVTQAGLGEASKLGLTLQTRELLLG